MSTDNDCAACLQNLVRVAPWRAALVHDGKVRAVNAGLLDFLAANENDLIDLPPAEVFPGIPYLSSLVSEAMRSGRTMRNEGTVAVKHQERAILVHAIPAGAGAVMLTVADLTAQREAQAGIAYAMAGGADDFWVFDEHRRLVFASAARLADLPADGDILALLTPGSRANAEDLFSWARSHPGEIAHATLTMQHGKNTIAVQIDGSYRFDSEYGGHFFCLLHGGALRDISVLKRLQLAYGVSSDTALAQKLRASPARISAVRGGRLPVAKDWVWRAYEDTRVSMDWLATGQGSMRKIG